MQQARRRLTGWAVVSTAAVVLFGCASPRQGDTSAHSLHDTLQSLAQEHHVCGVTLAIVKNRKLDAVESASGCTPAVAEAVAVAADSVFQAASLSKPVFAYAVLKLVQQGKLALDAPLLQYLPEGYRHRHQPLKAEPSDLVSDPRLQAVTARMVLSHTSGLPNWASGPLGFDAAPGVSWGYSGEGFVLLQRAVEAVTGEPLDRFMAAQVFQPLGMSHSSYAWSEDIARKLVSGTKANGAPRKSMALKEPIAAFSLYTTAQDYGKFLVAVLKDAPFLSQVSAAPVPVEPSLGISWGLGWGLETTRQGSYLWHWGNNPGYRAFVMASPKIGDGFVMLTNSENGLVLAEPMAQRLLPDDHKLFQFSMLGDDVLAVICKTVRLCL
nr:serine hydrolase domain-containing protein [uncultured Albidiferax sp.]